MTRRLAISTGLFALAAFAGGCALEQPERFASALGSTGLVVSQVLPGGGNTNAFIDSDYVEIFNRGTASVSTSGMSVQYASGTSTSWSVVALPAKTLAPGGYLLVKLGAAGSGSPLPVTPDATDLTVSLNVSAGKIALVSNTTALTCGTSANRCFGLANVVDLVGYGSTGNSVSDYEGTAPAAGPSGNSSVQNNTVVIRLNGGCTDTDQNSTDFGKATWAAGPSGVTLHNSASTPVPCGTTTGDLATAADLATNVDLAGADLTGQPGLDMLPIDNFDFGTGDDLSSSEPPDLLPGPPDLSRPLQSTRPDPGCGCDVGGTPAPVPGTLLFAGALLAGALTRLRRRR